MGAERSLVGPRLLPPNEAFFTLLGEAGSSIVERVAIPLAARPGSVITAVQCDAPLPTAAVLA